MTFLHRLVTAAIHAGVVEPGARLEDRGLQSAIAQSLGLSKQTVSYWFRQDGLPGYEHLREIEKRWRVNGDWLLSGEGEMLDKPSEEGLTPEERDLVKSYRIAKPRVRKIIIDMVRAARKSIVTIAAVIPPFLGADSAISHNAFSATLSAPFSLSNYTLCALRRWLLKLVRSPFLPMERFAA
jgi:transcriptional regulator with XRE-family HTH domain